MLTLKPTALFLSILFFILSIYLSSYEWNTKPPASQYSDFMHKRMASYINDMRAFHQYITSHDSISISNDSIRSYIHQLRISYKTIEQAVAYLDPESAKEFWNGAPLPYLKKNINLGSQEIIEPVGLQVLDEIAGSDNPKAEWGNLVRVSTSLVESALPAVQFIQQTTFSDRMVIEAARFDLVRLFSLGITGFDTPGTLQAIEEARITWSIHDSVYRMYQPILEKNVSLKDSFERALRKGNDYLQNATFESFNRAAFTREAIQPLFQQWLRLQRVLQAEWYWEVSPMPQPFNFTSENFFASDFINPWYYTNIPSRYNKKALMELGATLFFDPILSKNVQRSCASCHSPEKAFADGLPKSIAMDFKGTVQRNAPGLINSVYADRYFYDLRSNFLEDQMDHVILSEVEFNTTYEEIIHRLNSSTTYVEQFKKIFPEQREGNYINKYTITQAMSAYIGGLTSHNSDFDRYMRGELSDLDSDVIEGFNLFMGKANCGICHFAPTFSGLVPPYFKENESEVLGIPATPNLKKPIPDTDPGRSHAQVREASDLYHHSFKTVSVRNAAYTAPYMHNGVFATLEEVMKFYNKGGGNGIGLHYPNQTLSDDPLHLSNAEIKKIISFIHALSDTGVQSLRPKMLPKIEDHPEWNERAVGGVY